MLPPDHACPCPSMGARAVPWPRLSGRAHRAHRAIDHNSELKALRDAVEDRRRDLEYREHDAEKVVVEDRTWTNSWVKACSTCWLGESGSAPPMVEVREILTTIADLGPTVEKRPVLPIASPRWKGTRLSSPRKLLSSPRN